MQRIPLDQITYDPHYYPRVNGKEDWFTVNLYKDALVADPKKADAKAKPTGNWRPFPPIVVVKIAAGFLILDGLHRLKAFAAAGLEVIYAEVERLPKSKWLARSVELNADQKRGLDTGDKAWVCQRLEAEGYSRKRIAGLLQMSVDTLDKIVVTRCQKLRVKDAKKLPTGRGNRQVNGGNMGFLKAPFGELTGTDKGRAALQVQQSCTARNVVQILDAFLGVLEAGALDMTEPEITERMNAIQDKLGALV
jgi:hypothetical protein